MMYLYSSSNMMLEDATLTQVNDTQIVLVTWWQWPMSLCLTVLRSATFTVLINNVAAEGAFRRVTVQ